MKIGCKVIEKNNIEYAFEKPFVEGATKWLTYFRCDGKDECGNYNNNCPYA